VFGAQDSTLNGVPHFLFAKAFYACSPYYVFPSIEPSSFADSCNP
jgi:hypothetical protein